MKFQTVAKKTKKLWGLLYFAAPCTWRGPVLPAFSQHVSA